MEFALTTHWNAQKHRSGETMIQEILDIGFNRIELGYDLTLDLVPGVRQMVFDKEIEVCSLHNFCPVPVGAPFGHPELFHLASTDIAQRRTAVKLTLDTVEFASDVEANTVVAHCGYVDLSNMTRKLIDLAKKGKQFEPKYEKLKMKLITAREKKVQRNLDALYQSIEELLPRLEDHKIVLALENLPSWEAVPNEAEMEKLCQHFDSPYIRYWHDLGHAQTRQSLGFIGHHLWLEKLMPYTRGMHIHDMRPPSDDHLMPPTGTVDFNNFKQYFNEDLLLVLEPAPGTPAQKISDALDFLNELCV